MQFSTKFAEACYNQNSIDELQHALNILPDATDLKTWEITEKQYYDCIAEAMHAKMSDEVK